MTCPDEDEHIGHWGAFSRQTFISSKSFISEDLTLAICRIRSKRSLIFFVNGSKLFLMYIGNLEMSKYVPSSGLIKYIYTKSAIITSTLLVVKFEVNCYAVWMSETKSLCVFLKATLFLF